MITLYGIPNCDTVKKAREWLETHGVAYRFHDFRKDGLEEATLRRWCAELGWERLLNRSGTTWRRLPEGDRADLDEAKAIRLMLANPAVIKRPVLDLGHERHVGFKEPDYARIFSGN